MAPARSSARRAHPPPIHPTPPAENTETDDPNVNKELFLDPMLGTPLAIYIEKDVDDKDEISRLIIKHGGTVSPGYSGVPYILVDPHKESGQNLWRQYAGKKGKIVLDVAWVHECIKMNQLQTFQSNWAGCKVTGSETVYPPGTSRRQDDRTASSSTSSRQVQSIHPNALQAPIPPVDPIHPHPYPFQIYAPPIQTTQPRAMAAAPPWPVGIAPSQAHIHPPPAPPPPNPHPQMIHRPPPPPPPSHTQPPPQPYRDDGWEGYANPEDMASQPPGYEYRYREEQGSWAPGPGPYYEPPYDHPYGQPPYMEDPAGQASGSGSVNGPPLHLAGPSAPSPADDADKPRGRKRTRTQTAPTATAASLVVNRNPPARSPTPPKRVVKSTYGGNLFTADDVVYLQKYIDYCQDQCLVLSLREICERIAVKAPHHTFYSWRRYCNKHQIRLGGYSMTNESRSPSPGMGQNLGSDLDEEQRHRPSIRASMGYIARLNIDAASAAAAEASQRSRSPTPPKALYRSTTGKGVAFTQEDVNFLVKFMEYRKSQGSLDMVVFWKDVAAKAPHHSRASWMKFWRRHKHELSRSDGDEPLPAPPDKKMRYSKEDDILLAKYFFNKPDGTSDKIFQAFGRLHPHHPWKGWQEHHRIHRTKIEHLMQLLSAGEDLNAQSDG